MFIISSFVALPFFLTALLDNDSSCRYVSSTRTPIALLHLCHLRFSSRNRSRRRSVHVHTPFYGKKRRKKKKKKGDEGSSLQLPQKRIDPRWQNVQKDRQFPIWRISKPNMPSTSIICRLVIGFVRASSRWKLARCELVAGTFQFCRVSHGWQVRVEYKSEVLWKTKHGAGFTEKVKRVVSLGWFRCNG